MWSLEWILIAMAWMTPLKVKPSNFQQRISSIPSMAFRVALPPDLMILIVMEYSTLGYVIQIDDAVRVLYGKHQGGFVSQQNILYRLDVARCVFYDWDDDGDLDIIVEDFGFDVPPKADFATLFLPNTRKGGIVRRRQSLAGQIAVRPTRPTMGYAVRTNPTNLLAYRPCKTSIIAAMFSALASAGMACAGAAM